jgi:hypothetical protein
MSTILSEGVSENPTWQSLLVPLGTSSYSWKSTKKTPFPIASKIWQRSFPPFPARSSMKAQSGSGTQEKRENGSLLLSRKVFSSGVLVQEGYFLVPILCFESIPLRVRCRFIPPPLPALKREPRCLHDPDVSLVPHMGYHDPWSVLHRVRKLRVATT